MRKYPAGQSVGAIYDNAPANNPFLAAMPEISLFGRIPQPIALQALPGQRCFNSLNYLPQLWASSLRWEDGGPAVD